MGVKVRFPPGNNNPAPIYDFTDDFSTDRVAFLYPELSYTGGMVVSITAGLLRYTGGATSGSCGVMCTGAPDLQGQANQYIQATLVSAPALLNRTGIAVKVSGAGQTGVGVSRMYSTFTHIFTGTINILGSYPTQPSYAIALALGAPALNDVFELFIECDATAGNRVRMWQNGTLLADVTDLDANRVVAEYGYPGLGGGGSGTGVTIDWDNLIVGRERP
jgi:hypothetical protein